MSPGAASRTTTRHREAGFTLVELVVAITIVGFVGSLFALVAFQSITITADASSSLADSSNRAVLATRLREDLESAGKFGRGTGPCAGPEGATDLFWTSSTDSNSSSVGYYVRHDADGHDELVRRDCSAAANRSTSVLAQWSGRDAATVTCESDCNLITVDVPSGDLSRFGDGRSFELTVARRVSS